MHFVLFVALAAVMVMALMGLVLVVLGRWL
jgi:hypothetical protein